jgi:hypothetical protein
VRAWRFASSRSFFLFSIRFWCARFVVMVLRGECLTCARAARKRTSCEVVRFLGGQAGDNWWMTPE